VAYRAAVCQQHVTRGQRWNGSVRRKNWRWNLPVLAIRTDANRFAELSETRRYTKTATHMSDREQILTATFLEDNALGIVVFVALLTWGLFRANQASLFVPKAQRSRYWKALFRWLAACVIGPSILVGVLFGGSQLMKSLHNDVARAISLLALGALGLWLLPTCLRLGKRSLREWARLCSPSAQILQAIDHRSPVIYLRSFRDDGTEIPQELTRPNFLTYEHVTLMRLQTFGPCFALGKPGEQLPELGATRLYVPHAQWQEKVSDLLSRAQLVLICASNTESLLWEIDHAFRNVPVDRIVLMFLWRNSGEVGRAERERNYRTVKQAISRITAIDMPERLLNGVFILFGKDESVTVIGDKEYPLSRKFEEYVEDLVWRLGVEKHSRATQ